jgi:hypothetical protein
MYYVRLLILMLGVAALLFLVAGLFKPWMMLWWEDTQNRKKVIQLYGSLSVFFLLVYWILKFF